MKTHLVTGLALMIGALSAGPARADTHPDGDGPARFAPVRVVATLPVYGSIVKEIGGNEVEVTSIADPDEDPHFVRPKPSFALELRRADMFITTGLDLELWAPSLLDKAGNSKVIEGGPGYVTAYTGIKLLDVPSAVDRSQGDVHIYGNPHVHTDPLRALQVARNITTGLNRVAPDRSQTWNDGLARFQDRIYRATFGDRLVELIGGETLEQLALAGNLHSFLDGQQYEGHPLSQELGGWLGKMAPYRGRHMICYHKNWAYLQERFDLTCTEYVEAKPGIPPTPRHVARLIELMQAQNIKVILAASYFSRNKVETVADRGGATAVIVPMEPGGSVNTPDYFSLVDHWVDGLTTAFAGTS